MPRTTSSIAAPAAEASYSRVGDPAGAELDEVRRVRTDIERRVTELATGLQNLAVAGSTTASSAGPEA